MAARRATRSVAVLGELAECALWDQYRGQFYNLPYRAGRILCATPDGREMYALCPRAEGARVRPDDMAIRAANLHERFVHRRANGYYNLLCPAPRSTPEFGGELAIIRYVAHKSLPDDNGELLEDEEVWEHYFDDPGRAPAYAQLWKLGHHQFWIPRGPWRITDEGIVFCRDK